MDSSAYSQTTMKPTKSRLDLAEANTTFAVHLYQALKKGKEGQNMFFSPLSVSIALAMVHLGARGNTATEIADALCFNQVETYKEEHLHDVFKELIGLLFQSENPGSLTAANKLYGKSGYPFLEAFLSGLESCYQTTIEAVDDFSSPVVTQSINEWVSEQTKGKINDLIAPGTLDSAARMVIVNAIYFEQKWEDTFISIFTMRDSFKVLDSRQTVPVKLMYKSSTLPLAVDEASDSLVLDLPYEDGVFTMMIALPRKDDGLAKLESELSASRIQSWIGKLRSRPVNLFLPKFRIEEQSELKKALEELGMSDVFDGNKANFEGISDDESLQISAVIHKAFVDVDEKGSEAAAATAIMAECGMGRPRKREESIDFRADHPFLFIIRHRETQSVIFIGRLNDPK